MPQSSFLLEKKKLKLLTILHLLTDLVCNFATLMGENVHSIYKLQTKRSKF